MSREFTFQDPGEGIHEGEIAEVSVSPGDVVQEGDTLFAIETDKATTELPSPYSGEIESVEVSSGDVVTVGDVLVVFADGEETEERSDDEETEERSDDEATGDEGEVDEGQADEGEADEAPSDDESGGRATAVGELPGSVATARQSDEEPEEHDERGERSDRSGQEPVPASPATRRLARELGVELAEVEPSGPDGRVTADDVRAAEEGTAEQQEPAEATRERDDTDKTENPPEPDFERWGPVEWVEMRGVRRSIAQVMARSWSQIPHVTHHDLADVTELERFRRAHAPDVEERGGELGLMILVMKALAGVLERHPRFNASLDSEGRNAILKQYRHVGVAVDTDDGLIVPVVRDVDRKPLIELAVEVSDLVARTRRRELEREEMQGGSITVTNVGPLGGVAFTPIIRHPEVAIVGMAQARLEQVVRGDLDDHLVEVRYVLPLSVSFDHRVNDGADAARFTADLAAALADPEALLLNV